MYKFIAVLALMTMTFWSCKDEINNTGYDLLLPGDIISANKVIFNKDSISAYTVRDVKLRTNKPDYNLLGTFVDPVFGKTTASFACQFHISGSPKFKKGDIIDSLVFFMTYDPLYGDTITTQNIKAYELLTGISEEDTASYFQDIDLKAMSGSEVVGEVNHRPRDRDSIYIASTDTSKDGTYKQMDTIIVRLRLKNELAQKIMDANFAAFDANWKDPNDPFVELFKGLYVEAGDLTQGGAIMSMKPRTMILYTRRPEASNDSIFGTYFDVTKNAARVNRFDHHEYATTSFVASLDQENQQDSLIYLQTTGGLSAKIYIPDLNDWVKDSSDVAINKAELILTVEPSFTDTVTYIPPQKLILSLIGDNKELFTKDGNLIYPADLTFSESYYGGTYNKEDGTYRFNLAGHLQKLIKEKDKIENGLKNNGFYLTTNNKNSVFNRVVLKGATSKTGIRFEVTYSRIK